MSDILLTTLNARYTHTAIGLRYLFANLRELQARAEILEFTINDNIADIAEKLLAGQPKIIGIGVHIWNAQQSSELMQLIKQVSPDTVIVLGGPEVSHAPIRIDVEAADHIIQGEGEIAFYELCSAILDGNTQPLRMIKAENVDLDMIELPYRYYSDEDVRHRYIYVEASRGCPFLCEFCLSSIDQRVRGLFIDRLLEELEQLWQRGVRSFKFIDRTFNLNMRVANRLLDFFLAKQPPYFVHFEVIPDHFPESLRERISRFPPASLQLEVGIQTLNSEVAASIRRKLNIPKIEENLRFLSQQTQAHMHLDLIIGLPGEDLASFGDNLDRLCALTRSEIQIGILKKLSGTTLARHDVACAMVYADRPPYELLQNRLIPFAEMQAMKRFARFWDLCYNSGNFNDTVRMLWPDGDVYAQFSAFASWIYGETRSTWKIALDRLAGLLFRYLVEERGHDAGDVGRIMAADLSRLPGRKLPGFLRPHAAGAIQSPQQAATGHNRRQLKHA